MEGFAGQLNNSKKYVMVPGAGIEPAQPQGPRDFKSLASTNSATQALELKGDGAYIILALGVKMFMD